MSKYVTTSDETIDYSLPPDPVEPGGKEWVLVTTNTVVVPDEKIGSQRLHVLFYWTWRKD